MKKLLVVFATLIMCISMVALFMKVEASNDKLTFESLTAQDAIQRTENNEKVLLYFGSDKCQACSIFTPILKAEAEKYKATVYYLDMDAEGGSLLKEKYNLYYTPTLLLYKNGTVERIEGAIPKEELSDYLEKWSE